MKKDLAKGKNLTSGKDRLRHVGKEYQEKARLNTL